MYDVYRMEYIFNEIIPTYWKQGYLSFGDQKRIATVTDVRFVSDDILLVAHRACAKLYLIKIHDSTYTILDTLLLKINDTYYHPDSICVHKNRIYMTAYTNTSCIVDIIDTRLQLVTVIQIHTYIQYHGCCATDNVIYYGGVKDKDNNTPYTVYNTNTKTFTHMKMNYNRRIKSISVWNDNILLGLDDLHTKKVYDSYIMYYTLDTNILLDSIHIKNSQIDGSVIYKNYFFITLHSGIDKCGYIYIGTIHHTNITFVKKVRCNDFPHGIDVYNNTLAYTSYANSSITVHSLSDFIDETRNSMQPNTSESAINTDEHAAVDPIVPRCLHIYRQQTARTYQYLKRRCKYREV